MFLFLHEKDTISLACEHDSNVSISAWSKAKIPENRKDSLLSSGVLIANTLSCWVDARNYSLSSESLTSWGEYLWWMGGWIDLPTLRHTCWCLPYKHWHSESAIWRMQLILPKTNFTCLLMFESPCIGVRASMERSTEVCMLMNEVVEH